MLVGVQHTVHCTQCTQMYLIRYLEGELMQKSAGGVEAPVKYDQLGLGLLRALAHSWLISLTGS